MKTKTILTVFAAYMATLVICFGMSDVPALAAASTHAAPAHQALTHHAPAMHTAGFGPDIPGCSGGNNSVLSYANANWYWAASGSPNPILFLNAGDGDEFCATATTDGYQLIHDVLAHLCVGVNGTTDIYEKPCQSDHDWDQWLSTGSASALDLVNRYYNAQGYNCNSYDYVLTDDDLVDNATMQCPDATGGTQAGPDQTWIWKLI